MVDFKKAGIIISGSDPLVCPKCGNSSEMKIYKLRSVAGEVKELDAECLACGHRWGKP